MSNFLITKRYLEDFQLSTIFCRLAVIVTFILSSAGGTAWGQTVTKTIKLYAAAGSGSYSTNFQSEIEAAFTELGKSLADVTCFTRWDVVKDGYYVTLNHDWAAPNTIKLSHADHHKFANHYLDNNKQFGYSTSSNPLTLAQNLNATLDFGTGISQLGCKIECWVSNVNNQNNADPEGGYIVKVELTLNEDGNPPYAFVNETNIAATKKVVPLTTFEENNKVLDLTDALVSGAKYARIYLSKYGNANAASTSLSISYNGNPLIQCASPYQKYGWYFSEAGGIEVSKLSVTGLDPAEMLKYNVIIVSSTSALSGEKEPAWEKKTVYSFQ